MKLIAAGSNTKGLQMYCEWYDVAKLYSFLNEQKEIERWNGKNMLMIDSGAHSWNKETINNIGMKGKKELKAANEFIRIYYEFIKQYKELKAVWVEFDVYGHLPIQWVDLLWKRVKSLEIGGKFMRVYHPILDGGTCNVLRKWVDEGAEYVGIGNDSEEAGVVPHIFKITRDKIRVHGFAMTKMPLLERYPFFSADSTSAISTVIFGKYAEPMIRYKARDEVIAEKSIQCFHGDSERVERSIIEYKITEQYLTRLWEKRGIIWSELQF